MTTPATSPSLPIPAKPFHERLLEDAHKAAGALLHDYPELRSVAVIFDYAGDLNDSATCREATWIMQPYGGSKRTTEGSFHFLTALLGIIQQASRFIFKITRQKPILGDKHERRQGPADPGAERISDGQSGGPSPQP